ncbi:hypothetical protein RRF57_000701 [Xylaria bambusicola]|uniref:Uncharacterized protein n=1 Tax=Xylaria bambusicola TaxID=326684 RepID=A0AAN7UAA1_9PEZI
MNIGYQQELQRHAIAMQYANEQKQLHTFVNIPEEACMVDGGGRRRVPLGLGHELLVLSFAIRDQLFESTLLAEGGTRKRRRRERDRDRE